MRLTTTRIQEEANTNAAYGTALHKFHREELAFLAAQAKFERAKTELQVEGFAAWLSALDANH